MFYIDKKILAFFQGYADLFYHKYDLSKTILVAVMVVIYFAINLYLFLVVGKNYYYGIFLWQH